MNYFKALTIAGSDSGGGAGIQADLKTFSALGCYGMSVLTALTAQNTLGVQSIFPVSSQFIREQIRSVLSDIGADSVKIGMLHSAEVIEAVAFELGFYDVQNIVLDPVMIAKSGHALLQAEAIEALKSLLLPLSLIVTPNLPEAETLVGFSVSNENQMLRAGEKLLEWGPRFVVVKGGHLQGAFSSDCVCFLDEKGNFQSLWLSAERVETENSHGTGCTLSSAMAAGLAKGRSVLDAVSEAKAYLSAALKAGSQFQLGHGHGPVQHFFAQWEAPAQEGLFPSKLDSAGKFEAGSAPAANSLYHSELPNFR